MCARASAEGMLGVGGQEEAVPHGAAAASPLLVSPVVGSQASAERSPPDPHGWTWLPQLVPASRATGPQLELELLS